MSEQSHDAPQYSGARAVMAEGARVGFISCLRCGATLTIDSGDWFDVRQIHDEWHAANERPS